MYADEFHGFLFSGNNSSFGSHYYIGIAITAEMLPDFWANAFDIAEVHVEPVWQSKGIGRILIRTLCDILSDGQVALIVEVGNSRAHRLYQEIGFSDLPTPEGFPVHVMGTSLPVESPTRLLALAFHRDRSTDGRA
jgi:ribosomal protein S18 acetylase RimI-like enzyme